MYTVHLTISNLSDPYNIFTLNLTVCIQSIYLSIGINVRFAAMMADVGDGNMSGYVTVCMNEVVIHINMQTCILYLAFMIKHAAEDCAFKSVGSDLDIVCILNADNLPSFSANKAAHMISCFSIY